MDLSQGENIFLSKQLSTTSTSGPRFHRPLVRSTMMLSVRPGQCGAVSLYVGWGGSHMRRSALPGCMERRKKGSEKSVAWLSGAIRCHLRSFEAIWSHLGPSEAIWSDLERSVAIWSHLGPSGAIRCYLESFEAIWGYYLEPFEAFWSHLGPFGTT